MFHLLALALSPIAVVLIMSAAIEMIYKLLTLKTKNK